MASFHMAAAAAATAATLACLSSLASAGAPAPPRPLLHGNRMPSVQTVILSKQSVPVRRRGQIVAHKTAYFGTIFVGLPRPQPFDVLFDTGSGHVFFPSERCSDSTCRKHHRYQRRISESAVDMFDNDSGVSSSAQPDQVDLVYGTGQVSGDLLDETVCLYDTSTLGSGTATTAGCARLRVVLARKLTPDPFDHFSFDGVVGLGLESLALDGNFSFFGRLVAEGHLPEPCFGVFLSQGSDAVRSEISFGGHNKERVSSDFDWAPVALPEQGYWQVEIKGVRVGTEALNQCSDGGCRAVLDTGTSLLGVPLEALPSLHNLLARPTEEPSVNCQKLPGPPIIFDLGGFELRLEAEDYSRPAPMAVRSKSGNSSYSVCRASLMPVQGGEGDGALMDKLFIFGEPFLQKHYTKYDWRQKRIGFAKARQDPAPGDNLSEIQTV